MNVCTLYELVPEYGKIYINSGFEEHMICGGRELARECPEYDFVVERDGEAVWSSRDEKEAEAAKQPYRLVRVTNGETTLIAPGAGPKHLIEAGTALAAEQPEWTLLVQDAELNPVWTHKKSAPGKAEDATKENG